MLEIKKLQTPQNSICEAFSAFITYNPGSKNQKKSRLARDFIYLIVLFCIKSIYKLMESFNFFREAMKSRKPCSSTNSAV